MEPSKEAPSTNGTPRMRPRRVPLYLVIAGVLATLSQTLPPELAEFRPWCAMLAAVIGAASPGLRK